MPTSAASGEPHNGLRYEPSDSPVKMAPEPPFEPPVEGAMPCGICPCEDLKLPLVQGMCANTDCEHPAINHKHPI